MTQELWKLVDNPYDAKDKADLYEHQKQVERYLILNTNKILYMNLQKQRSNNMKLYDTRTLEIRRQELEDEFEEIKNRTEQLEIELENPDLTEEEIDDISIEIDEIQMDEDDVEELDELNTLKEEISSWEDGETLIPEEDFEEYCIEMLEDCGDLPKDLPWYIEIDWEATAENIRQDYTEMKFLGEIYLYRAS